MVRLWRKLTTRPVWWWERRQPRRYLDNIFSMPPVVCSQNAGYLVAVLGTADTFREILWTSWSLARFIGGEARFGLFVDGTVTPEMRRQVQRVLSGASVESVRPYLETSPHLSPPLRNFLAHHPMALKLLLTLFLQDEEPVLYCDNDVLFFKKPDDLLTLIHDGGPCAYIEEETPGSADLAMLEKIESRQIPMIERLNGGLLFISRDGLDLALAEELLSDWQPPMTSWFTEQTLNRALFGKADAVGLPTERFVLNNRRQFYWERDVDYSKIVARHFTGPVRHLYYSKGLRVLIHQAL